MVVNWHFTYEYIMSEVAWIIWRMKLQFYEIEMQWNKYFMYQIKNAPIKGITKCKLHQVFCFKPIDEK